MTTPGGQLTPGDEPEIGDPPKYGVPDSAYVGDASSSQSIKDLNGLTADKVIERQTTPVAVKAGDQYDKQLGALWVMLGNVAHAITGQTPAGDPLEYVENWLADERANNGAVIADYGTALGELNTNRVEPWAVPTVSPLSATINRRADASFQLSDMMVPSAVFSGKTSSNQSNAGDSGTNHDHSPGTLATSGAMARGGDWKGRTYFSFITPAINRAYEQLNFMVSAVSLPACRLDVAIYVVDENRQLIQQVLQTDVGNGLTAGEAVVTVRFPRWLATQGSYLAVAFLQHGTGNARQLLGLNDTPRPLAGNIFPRKISAIHPSTGMVALPAAIDGDTQVDFPALWFAPYAELSEDVGVEYRTLRDTFTVYPGRNIARPWITLTSRTAYVNSDGYLTVPGGLIVWNGPRIAVYESPLSTDRVQSTVRVLASDDLPDGPLSFAALRCSNNMSVGVGVFVGWGRIQIRSWSTLSAESIYTSSTVRASTPFDLSTDREFTATWEDGEVAVYDESNTAILSWTDTVTQKIARHRFVGIGVERSSGDRSPSVDDWAARDLPPVEDEGEPA